MVARDWLLLLIAYRGAPDGLDPVRLQKGMFLLAMEGDLPEDEQYSFRPYNYGPMSRGIYDDLETLEGDGLVERRAVEGRTWDRMKATTAGIARAREVLEAAKRRGSAAPGRLFEIKRQTATQSFSELLHDVYVRYPDYATRSIFRG